MSASLDSVQVVFLERISISPDVKAVNLSNVKGKTKKASRNTMGKRADWKKAYVSIKAGQEINFTGE